MILQVGYAAFEGFTYAATVDGIGRHQWNVNLSQFSRVLWVGSKRARLLTSGLHVFSASKPILNCVRSGHGVRQTFCPVANPTYLHGKRERVSILGCRLHYRSQCRGIHRFFLGRYLLLLAQREVLDTNSAWYLCESQCRAIV